MKPFIFNTIALTALLFLTAGCNYPRDPEQTTKHVHDSKMLKAGVVTDLAENPIARSTAQMVADKANARLVATKGNEESLFGELEHGRIDIIIGAFAANSPWSSRAALTSSPQVEDPPEDLPVIRAAVRRGENRWFMFVEDAFNKQSAGGSS